MKPRLLLVLIAGILLAADAGKDDLEKMQGDWNAIAFIRDGMKYPDDDANALFRTVKGNDYTISRFEKTVGKGTFKIDATRKPKTIDLVPANAKPILGIYEFDGDKLRMCYSVPGGERPKAFESKMGQTQTLVVWEREKK